MQQNDFFKQKKLEFLLHLCVAQLHNLSISVVKGALFTRKTSLNHLTYDRQEIYHVIWQTKVMFLQRFSSSFDVWITCFKAWKHGSVFKTLGMVFHFQIPHSNLNAFQQSLANLILRKRLKKKNTFSQCLDSKLITKSLSDVC